MNTILNTKTFIIAEAGVNHNGSLEIAKALVRVAAEAGADAIKFQSFRTSDIVCRSAHKARYQVDNTGNPGGQYEMLKALELTDSDQFSIWEYCSKQGIQFISSAFDEASINLLERIGVELYKIPSGEITSLPLLRRIAQTGKPTIISTGMATHSEIEGALNVFYAKGYSSDQLALLHCTTNYPTPYEEINLNVMHTLRRDFGLRTGLSDHTKGIESCIAAVAIGAEIIEKHFTLDRKMEGPDHLASITPEDLKVMVQSIRNVEIALGDGIKLLSKDEIENRNLVRKSIVAKKAIKKGEILSHSNLTIKRPGNGISPMRWDEFIGSKALRDYNVDDPIED